jgi:three-Cys-motif partner protein
MPKRDLHKQPFDESTKTKLLIYRSYIRAWLQVFLHTERSSGKPLQFFDFFCGPGEDSAGEPGSPLIVINELLAERAKVEQRGHNVRLFFNDQDASKIDNLKRLSSEKSVPWHPRFESLDFAEAFKKVGGEIGKHPSLVFIDQNGLKHVTKKVFVALAAAATTDFLFFTASSFKQRFGDLLAPEIKLPVSTSRLDVHRVVADVYRQWAPKGIFVGHFSLKKGTNVYGVVFGSHHWRGMLKFLEIVWKLDASCGEADYELEQDTAQGIMDFEQGTTGFKKRKVEVFQERLKHMIASGRLKTDDAVFLCCLENGFLPRVAKDVYIRLRDDGVLKNSKATFPRSSAEVMHAPRRIET